MAGGDWHMKTCSECPDPIPTARLEIWPYVQTCSKVCAAQRKRKRQAAGAARSHKRSGYKAQKKYLRKRKQP